MSLAADALQPNLVRQLLSLSGRSAGTHLADVITNAPRAGYDLDFDAADSAIKIDFREPEFIAAAIAGDASRFAAACFTSLHGIAPAVEQADTLAWALVRMYYAAFYGGHGVLRLLGASCSQLDSRHVTALRTLADARGTPPPFALGAGLYHCRLNTGQTGLTMTHAHGKVGGTHEAFWEIFDVFLSGSTERVLLGHLNPREAVAVFAKLEALRRIFRRGAGASWLSAIRNEIQYRHVRGVWAPPSLNRNMRGSLSRLAGQWDRDPMNVDIEAPPGGDLGAFVAACAFTAALCRALLTRVAERSAVGSRSFAFYPLRLC